MNVDRLINMIVRRLVNKGVNKGIDLAARGGKPDAELTPEERAQAQKAKGQGQSMRRNLGMLRRFMR